MSFCNHICFKVFQGSKATDFHFPLRMTDPHQTAVLIPMKQKLKHSASINLRKSIHEFLQWKHRKLFFPWARFGIPSGHHLSTKFICTHLCSTSVFVFSLVFLHLCLFSRLFWNSALRDLRCFSPMDALLPMKRETEKNLDRPTNSRVPQHLSAFHPHSPNPTGFLSDPSPPSLFFRWPNWDIRDRTPRIFRLSFSAISALTRTILQTTTAA